MKLRRILSVMVLFTLICTSCTNDLKVLAPYKNITVVYGLIDQNDPVHYVRINKGFEGSGNAYTMAQQYDSIYYPVGSISVVLEDSSTTSYSIVNTYKLDTITTIPLSPGTFSYPKQLLYYTKASLNPADYYNLVITNLKTGQKIIGSTFLLADIVFTSELYGSRIFSVSFNQFAPATIAWNSSANARIYQITIQFYYDEVTQAGRTMKSINWVLPSVTSNILNAEAAMETQFTGQQFCSFIGSSIPYEAGVTRYVDSIGIVFTSGTDDLNTYVQLSQPPLGINQDVPSFSDVKNGVGLFTARHIQTFYKLLNSQFIDSLVSEPQFQDLHFQQ